MGKKAEWAILKWVPIPPFQHLKYFPTILSKHRTSKLP